MTNIKSLFCFLTLLFTILFTPYAKAQDACETITKISIEKLVPLFQKNDYQSIKTTLNGMEATCGITEFTLRTRILYQIINREDTKTAIANYLENDFDNLLIERWDATADEKRMELYNKQAKKFNYIPLAHPSDNLLKEKALSLLNSDLYVLQKEEESLLYLFIDDIETYLQLTGY